MSKLNWRRTPGVLFLLCVATEITLPAQTLTVLHHFQGTDGYAPYGPLVQGTDGKLYGTTYFGGTGPCMVSANYGCGTVFEMSSAGALGTLYNFCAQTGCADGAHPEAGLIQATDGNFYGTTYEGGTTAGGRPSGGGGTVFEIAPSGALTTLYAFCPQAGCTDGSGPSAGLVQGENGDVYGTTTYGGITAGTIYGAGSVFKIGPSGGFTTVYDFCSQAGCTDGYWSFAPLQQATEGGVVLYGTTEAGGANDGGTVFRVSPGGALTTLYSFCSQTNCDDGAQPVAGLVQASDGNFYGTTYYGGTANDGTVFKISPYGRLKMLYSFCSKTNCTDGAMPRGGLLQATDGNLYGTTLLGGANGFGTVFEITSSDTLMTLYSFCSQPGCTDGANPAVGLIQSTDGKLYGTTAGSGSGGCPPNCGVVFGLDVGLGPFVETEPTFGKVGGGIKILGTNLAGATSVTFNGTPAAFTVEASSVIKATVPAGATTGTVQVVTPGGTLSSNVPFRAAP